jgi:hypothetical protein
LLGVSFTCVSQGSFGAALALGAAQSPSTTAAQTATTHERRCNLVRCGM